MTTDLSELNAAQLDRLTTLMVQSGHLSHPLRLQAHVETDVAADQLKAELVKALPSHMVPAAIITASALPRLPNGKLDRASLAAPKAAPRAETPPQADTSDAASREVKEALRSIWVDVLGVDQIYDEDNFFELGGDSLLSISVVSRARAEGLSLIPSDLFDYETLAELATHTQASDTPLSEAEVSAQPLAAQTQGDTDQQMFIINANRRMLELLNDQLATRRSIHLLTMHWDSGAVSRNASVGTIAEEFIDRICAIQPEGPYRLGGFSMGAVVAHEVAHQLKARGQEVQELMMIDPPENCDLFADAFNTQHRFRGHKEDRLQLKSRFSNVAILTLARAAKALGIKKVSRLNSRLTAMAYLKAARKYTIAPPVIAPIIVRREIPQDTTLWAQSGDVKALHQITCSHFEFHRDEATIRKWTGILAQSLEAARR